MRKQDFKNVFQNRFRSIYDKLGKEQGLQAVLDDFYRRMSKDVLIGFFFTGKDTDAIARKQKDFLIRAMGITASYSGKPPADAHGNLPPILMGHFDRRLRILEQTLQDHGLSAEDTQAWVAFENAFRDGIVKDPARPDR